MTEHDHESMNVAPGTPHDSMLSETVSYLIGMVRGHVDRSVLYIAPYPGAITSDPSVNEEDLPSVGCRYDIGPEGTDELVDILKGGEINSIAPEKAMPVVDARTAIFIYQNKKRVMMMLILADPLPGETFMRGVWNRRYAVRTGSHLQSALRAFAKSLTPITTHPGCASN